MADRPAARLAPAIHDLVVALRAPTQAWSGVDGDMAGGAQGIHHGDWRMVAGMRLTIDGRPVEPLRREETASTATFVGMARGVDDATKDPRVLVERTRTVRAGEVEERIVLRNASDRALAVAVELRVEPGIAPLFAVRAGTAGASGEVIALDDGGMRIERGPRGVTLQAAGASLRSDSGVASGSRVVTVSWQAEVPVGGRWMGTAHLALDDADAVVQAAAATWTPPRVDDERVATWVAAALADLEALMLAPTGEPDASLVAAGAPWYLTLFGRDALTTARMLLPLGTDLAAGTLRALARRQATDDRPEAAATPGKILHELRATPYEVPREGIRFPPRYYGTIDATPLWICVLHDAWRAGMPEATVRELLPTLHAALAWMRDHGDADGDGFLEYRDPTGRGLANQGWKDSADAVRFHDGTLADGPIALCEVQALACEAFASAAALLDAFGADGDGDVDGAATCRAEAQTMRERFRARFWVERDGIRFPAMALDGAKRPVDALTSNVGQLLGTGILDAGEEAQVAALLVAERLASGFGLRTMATDEGGYWPLSYHCGSVWPHDTALAIRGLQRAGHGDAARTLATQLVRAAEAFGWRIPELYGGESAGEAASPTPYPYACRPQAWSAASAIVVADALGVLASD